MRKWHPSDATTYLILLGVRGSKDNPLGMSLKEVNRLMEFSTRENPTPCAEVHEESNCSGYSYVYRYKGGVSPSHLKEPRIFCLCGFTEYPAPVTVVTAAPT